MEMVTHGGKIESGLSHVLKGILRREALFLPAFFDLLRLAPSPMRDA